MFLCIDVGNSHLCGGVYAQGKFLFQFRYDSKRIGTSDELGVFIRGVLRENNIDFKQIQRIGIASVVPSIDYTIHAACVKYLGCEPLLLQAGVKTGIQIRVPNPQEVGADLIAGAMAARHLFPKKNLMIFDLGTATTFCYLNANAEFIGGVFAPGVRLMMESLHNNTAKLFGVDIVKPESFIGKTTKSAIQSGIYYAQLGCIQQFIENAHNEIKGSDEALVIATGGFSQLYAKSKLFDQVIPELVLFGIKLMLEMNE